MADAAPRLATPSGGPFHRPSTSTVAVRASGLLYVHPGADGRSGVAALRGVELTIGAGEVAAVVGPSGSGKSSLLRVLAGLERPTAGTIDVHGRRLDLADDRELDAYRREEVGFVEQHYWRALSPSLPIEAAVGLPLRLRGASRRAAALRAAQLLERTGLGNRAHARPAELSGGERQRVAVAAALAHRPRLLLADEPTGELDEETARHLLALTAELVRGEGTTAVIVTHDALVEAVSDRIVVLRDGRAVAERSDGVDRQVVDAHGWLAPAIPTVPPRAASGAPGVARGSPIDATGRPAIVAQRQDAICLEDVRHARGRSGSATSVFDGLSVTVPAGGFHAIVGPSGTGKTSLLRLASGLDRPVAGRVVTLGEDLAALDADALARLRATRIGIVEQAARLVPFLSVHENVALGLAIRGASETSRDDRIGAALDRLSVLPLADRRPDELSAGERIRVAIARAVAAAPELVLLDEPTAALDRGNAAAVAALLRELVGSGATVVAATHDPDLIAASDERFDLRSLAGPGRRT